MLNIFSKKNQKGFSILEAMVALSIITVGILAVLSLFTQTIRSGQLSSNQEIATNLAQEGIEVIRNKRDSNWVELKDWNDGINETGYYKVNFNDQNKWVIEKLALEGFQKLYLRDVYIYTHDNTNPNVPTIFERKIYINNATDILEITSTVQWTERGSAHSVIMQDNLYDWQ